VIYLYLDYWFAGSKGEISRPIPEAADAWPGTLPSAG
jgi:hypothetical protein